MIIYSPLDGLALTDYIEYSPRSCFIMSQLSNNLPKNLLKIQDIIYGELKKRKIKIIDATSRITGRDFLMKIWRQILEVPMGIAIISNTMNSNTIANIFYELGILDSLGKESIVIKTDDCEIPSNLIRTEYILYGENFTVDFNKFIDTTFEQAKHYETISGTTDVDPILSIDYLQRAYLITGEKHLIKKIKKIYNQNKFDDRSKSTIQNFLKISLDKNELLILEAKYGTKKKFIDGDKTLNNLIIDDKLKTTASNKIFGDPDKGIKKILNIKYSYNCKTNTKTFNENDIVELP